MIKPPVSAITISQQDNTTESTPSMRLKKRGGKKSAMTGEQTPGNNRSSSVKKDWEFLSINNAFLKSEKISIMHQNNEEDISLYIKNLPF